MIYSVLISHIYRACPSAYSRESLELDTSKITFVLLGDSDPQAKADWVANRIESGATDVLFFDDSSTLFDGFRVLWKFLWILIVSV